MWSPTMTSGACIARFWRIGWGWTPGLSSAGRLKSLRTSSRGGQGIGGLARWPPVLIGMRVGRSIMLTETVAGRTYDYSHNVGRGAATGMGFANPVALALDADGVVYVANR